MSDGASSGKVKSVDSYEKEVTTVILAVSRETVVLLLSVDMPFSW